MMKKVVLSLLALLLFWLMVLIAAGSIQESEGLRYVKTLKQERDALYKNFNDSRNGASEYLEAFRLFQAAPTKAVEEEIRDIAEHSWKEPSPEAIQWMEANASAVELIQAGNRKPTHLMPRIERAEDLLNAPPLTVRGLASILIAMGKRAEASGDVARALHYYLDAVQFGYGLETDRTIIGFMLGVAVRNLGFAGLREACHNVHEPGILKGLLAELERLEAQAVPLIEGFKSELLAAAHAMNSMYREYKQGKHALGTEIEEIEWLDNILSSATRSRNPLWRWYLSERRAFGYVSRWYIRLIKYSALPYAEAARMTERLEHFYGRPRDDTISFLSLFTNPIGKLYAWIAIPNIAKGQEIYSICEANERTAQLTAMLQLFKLQHSSFPQELSQLHTTLGFQVPQDPFSGQPFRYTRKGSGYILYSVGPDLKDDGGTIAYNVDHLTSSDLLYNLI